MKLENMKMGDEVFLSLREYARGHDGHPSMASFLRSVRARCKHIGGRWIIEPYIDDQTGEDMIRVGLKGTPLYREDRNYE